jgi:hypothetical protein
MILSRGGRSGSRKCSAWNLRTIKAQHIGLTAEDKVYRLDASDLITSESFFFPRGRTSAL